MQLRRLVGSGDRIGIATAPFVLGGVILNVVYPEQFSVGGPSNVLAWISWILLIPGIIVWAWSVLLILTMVPRNELITTGPYAIAKHPLYTSVALLVLPWAGFLIDTWCGVVLGAVLYVAARKYARDEEAELSKVFGQSWDDYCRNVILPWL